MGAITHKNIKDNLEAKKGTRHAKSGDTLSTSHLISEAGLMLLVWEELT